MLLFLVIWFTFSYCPIAHMVWFWAGPDAYTSAAGSRRPPTPPAGYIWQWGALDFAGGTVVHINAGVAGLVGAFVLGKRVGFGKEPMAPHSLTHDHDRRLAAVVRLVRLQRRLGARSQRLRRARLHEHLPRHRLRGAVLDRRRVVLKGKPSMLGAASGAVAGLVAITPAAGNVGIPGAFVIGLGRRAWSACGA